MYNRSQLYFVLNVIGETPGLNADFRKKNEFHPNILDLKKERKVSPFASIYVYTRNITIALSRTVWTTTWSITRKCIMHVRPRPLWVTVIYLFFIARTEGPLSTGLTIARIRPTTLHVCHIADLLDGLYVERRCGISIKTRAFNFGRSRYDNVRTLPGETVTNVLFASSPT